MIGLIRAELLKVRTTRVVYGLLAGAIALGLLVVIGNLVTAPEDDTSQLSDILESTFSGLIALVLGILSVTTEFRHRTSSATFLVTPTRWRVLASKAVAMALVGVVLGAATVAVTVLVGIPLAPTQGVELAYDGAVRTIAGVLLETALWALLGVGIGALVRNQVLAIVGSLIYVFVVESILSFNLGDNARFLLSSVSAAIVGNEDALEDFDVASTLGFVAALAVFLVWIVLFNVAGWLRTERSDIGGE